MLVTTIFRPGVKLFTDPLLGMGAKHKHRDLIAVALKRH